jgi:hypothetical protein
LAAITGDKTALIQSIKTGSLFLTCWDLASMSDLQPQQSMFHIICLLQLKLGYGHAEDSFVFEWTPVTSLRTIRLYRVSAITKVSAFYNLVKTSMKEIQGGRKEASIKQPQLTLRRVYTLNSMHSI